MTNLIIETLERCGERAGDITAAVYDAFFTASPEASELMAHSDEGMKGRMLAQTIELLFDEDAASANNYLRWEVKNHVSAYAVHLEMYPAFLAALRDTVARTLGDEWGVCEAQAWDTRINTLLDDINAV
ncbi:MAG: hypothetical protein ACFHXK_17185 [bacterium]